MGGRVERFLDYDAAWLGWHCLSLGAHIDLRGPYAEIHFPGGWARFGWFVWVDLGGGGGFGVRGKRWNRKHI